MANVTQFYVKNVTKPLQFIGAPCDLDRNYWGEFECHYSCPLCNAAHSCDWSSCYDDLGFLEFLIDLIGQNYCLDLNHIHLSGISNGGMLAYFVMATATDGIGIKIIFYTTLIMFYKGHSFLVTRLKF